MLFNLFKQLRPAMPAVPQAADEPYSLVEALGEFAPIQILDVGAMMLDGEAPYGGLVGSGHARVTGFEPTPAECYKLSQHFGAPHRFFPYFIGDGEPATFYETTNPLTGSLYKPNRALLEQFVYIEEFMRLVAEHPVQTQRLDDIAELGPIDFIKIDVQGAELKVFQGGPRTLASVLVIQTEVEFLQLYENQPLFADVDTYLRAQGFHLHTFWTFGQRCFKPAYISDQPAAGLRQNLWSDAIYVRDWMRLEALSVDQLKKYALLVDHLYGAKDLTCKILTHLDARTGSSLAPAYVEAWGREIHA